jgi:hypothetical protein
MKINFSDWTDAQLSAATRFAHIDPQGPALLAEIKRREEAGIWLTDGSTEQVAQRVRSNSRRRKIRPRTRQ